MLQIISGSPGDLQPAFGKMLAHAARICDAKYGNVFRLDGDTLHLVASHNTPAALIEARRRVRLNPKLPFGRMVATKAAVQVADIMAEEAYTVQRDPRLVAPVEIGGARTVLVVPLLKEGEVIGAFSLYRQEVRPFSDKQVELFRALPPRPRSRWKIPGCSTSCAGAPTSSAARSPNCSASATTSS